MVVDSAGTLHYASAADATINGVAYTAREGDNWRPLSNIARVAPGSDLSVRQGYEPVMILTRGNTIHVFYIGAGHSPIYYTKTRVDAPEIVEMIEPTQSRVDTSPQVLSEVTTATLPLSPTIQPVQVTTIIMLPSKLDTNELSAPTGQSPIVIAFFAALVVVIGALAIRRRIH